MTEPNTNITGNNPSPPAAAPAAPPAAVTAKPAAPPPKPAAAAKPPAKGKGDRRFFLFSMFGSWFAVAWASMAASLGLMTLGTLRFLFPNVLSEPPSRVKAGPPDSYEEGQVVDRYKDQNFWVVRN